MGLFPHCTVTRFLDGLANDQVEETARNLFSIFFEAAGAQRVLRVSDVLSVQNAISSFSAELASFTVQARAANGVFFELDGEKRSNRWSVVKYGGPIPMLEFMIHHGQGVPPSEPSCRTMIKSGGAHVLWIDRRGCYGNPDNLYIHKKQRRIFPRMTQGIPRQSALGAGLEIRRLCREAWAEGAGKKLDAFWLSGLRKNRAFERDFDRVLIERIGRPRLEQILRDLGSTTLDCWLDVQ